MASSGEEEKRSIPAMSTTATGPKTHETSTKIPPSIKDKELDFLIMVSVRCGHVRVLNRIHKELPNYSFSFQHTSYETDNNQFTPLLYACKYNQKEVLEWLLPKVKKHDKTRDRETALILAVKHKEVNLELIRSLLKDGHQNLGDKDKHKMTALHIACSKGCMDVVKLLLHYNNAWSAQRKVAPKILGRKELKNKDGNTPFMLALSKNTECHWEIVKMWLEMEREPSMILRHACNDVNKKGFNAVMIAALSGQLKCLKIMEDYNAITDDINTMKTMSGWNIIHCAVASGCLETVKWLLTMRADKLKTTEILDEPNKKGYTPFLLACEYNHVEIAQYFINLSFSLEDEIEININAKTEKGMTGLHLATMHDAKEIVELLLEYGLKNQFDIMAQEEKFGNTALHIATSKCSMRVENLLKNKEPMYEQLKSIKNVDNKTAEDIRKSVHIPLEIRKRGEKSIDAYLKALREGKTKNNRCNLIVLGEERVGKTSLIRSLLGMDFDPECAPTEGVKMIQVETAEFVEIVVPAVEFTDTQEQLEVWKAAVSPEKRASEQITDLVAKAVTEADPKHLKGLVEENRNEKLERDLLNEVKKIIRRLKLAEEKHKSTQLKNKRHPLHLQTKNEIHLKAPTLAPILPPSVNQSPKLVSFQKVPHPPKPPAPWTKIPVEATVEVDQTSRDPSAEDANNKASVQTSESMSYQESTAVAKKVYKNTEKEQENIIFHAVDFAGQSHYRLMHHCFITHRAIYLVVFKLTDLLNHIQDKGSHKKDPVFEMRYWLNNIIAHASIDKIENNGHPKIFLVGTHKKGENGIGNSISEKDMSIINQHLLKVFVEDTDETRYQNSVQWCHDTGGEVVFAIENSMTKSHRAKSGICHLMSHIQASFKEIPFLQGDFPISYMRFEKKLFEMREERKNEPLVTTRKEVETWAKECGISDDEGVDTAIQFFHDIRVIIDQTLISSPFKQRQPSLNDPIVLLSPQWLGDVMRKIVDPKIGVKNLPVHASKSLNMLGIIHKPDLLGYLSSTVKSLPNTHTNLLEVLELYCLIYPLSELHCRLLGFKPKDELLVKENYLIPVKLPESIDSCSLIQDCYSFEFDFQSYLPEEIYIYTICYFLSLITKLEGFEPKYVTLSKSCSKFMFVRLGSLPKAHWTISVSKSTQTLVFKSLPLEKVEHPSQFVVEVTELILRHVCINSSLGYLEYKGGPRIHTKCDNGKDVLLPVVNLDFYNGLRVAENGMVECPNCGSEMIDANLVLSKMIPDKKSNIPHYSTVLAKGHHVSEADQKPTTSELDKTLKSLVEWECFAMHLRDIKSHDIKTIMRDYRTVKQQKLALYDKWVSVCCDASWLDVITALEEADEMTLKSSVENALTQ